MTGEHSVRALCNTVRLANRDHHEPAEFNAMMSTDLPEENVE